MGATCANPAKADSIEIKGMVESYAAKRLPHADIKAYKTVFERDLFMVVNLLRDNPLSFQNFVKNYVAKGKFEGDPNAANTLINRLRTLEKLEPIELSKAAADACYINLTKNTSGDKGSQLSGGAVNELKTI